MSTCPVWIALRSIGPFLAQFPGDRHASKVGVLYLLVEKVGLRWGEVLASASGNPAASAKLAHAQRTLASRPQSLAAQSLARGGFPNSGCRGGRVDAQRRRVGIHGPALRAASRSAHRVGEHQCQLHAVCTRSKCAILGCGSLDLRRSHKTRKAQVYFEMGRGATELAPPVWVIFRF